MLVLVFHLQVLVLLLGYQLLFLAVFEGLEQLLLLALHALGLALETEDSLPKELVLAQLLVQQLGF